MAIGFNHISATVTTDGRVGSFTPGAGELWYVENVEIYHDGTGAGNSEPDVRAGVGPNGADPGSKREHVLGSGVQVTSNGLSNNDSGDSGAIGRYFDSQDTLYYSVHQPDGANVYITISVRRVI